MCGRLAGVALRTTEWSSVPSELTFPDVRCESANQFIVPQIPDDGIVTPVPERAFESSIHLHGFTFQLGIAFTL